MLLGGVNYAGGCRSVQYTVSGIELEYSYGSTEAHASIIKDSADSPTHNDTMVTSPNFRRRY
jgi:hypothetical protein